MLTINQVSNRRRVLEMYIIRSYQVKRLQIGLIYDDQLRHWLYCCGISLIKCEMTVLIGKKLVGFVLQGFSCELHIEQTQYDHIILVNILGLKNYISVAKSLISYTRPVSIFWTYIIFISLSRLWSDIEVPKPTSDTIQHWLTKFQDAAIQFIIIHSFFEFCFSSVPQLMDDIYQNHH